MGQTVVASPVLVLEKDWITSDFLRGEIESIGLSVTISGAAEDAVKRAAEQTHSLAIIGLGPTISDPLAVIRSLREKLPGLPILILHPSKHPPTFEPVDRVKLHKRAIDPQELKRLVCDLVGIASQDDPGTTLKTG